MKIKQILSRNCRVLGITGILASWLTIGLVWAGVATLPFLGLLVTGGCFSLAVIGLSR
jgi:hypothetical protein